MKKLQFSAFLNWNSLIGVWIFFTHLYAVSVSNPDYLGEKFDEIYADFNGTSYNSTGEMISTINLNKSEIIEVQGKYLYGNGISYGAKLRGKSVETPFFR